MIDVIGLALSLASGFLQEPQEDAGRRLLAVVPDAVELSASDDRPRSRVLFGRNGSFAVYRAYRGQRLVAMDGARELGTFRHLDEPEADAGRSHFVFRAGYQVEPSRDGWRLLSGDGVSTFESWLGPVAVSSRGELAFWVEPGYRGLVHPDEARDVSLQVGSFASEVLPSAVLTIKPEFSLDGRTCVAVSRVRDRRQVVLVEDGKASFHPKKFLHVQDIALSGDGSAWALTTVVAGHPVPPGVEMPAGVRAGKWRVYYGRERLGMDSDAAFGPVLSSDGKRCVYRFLDDRRMGVAERGRGVLASGEEFVGRIFLDEGRGRLAFVVNRGGEVGPFRRLLRDSERYVEGGKWSLMLIGPDSQQECVLDGGDQVGEVAFSPSGYVAATYRVGQHWFLSVKGRTFGPFDDAGGIQFTGNPERVAFGVRVGRELRWRVEALN
ncbi:MAG: hypothetical protein NXI31_11355 [bacterium]|nr:hypothetical protein [bacterium]